MVGAEANCRPSLGRQQCGFPGQSRVTPDEIEEALGGCDGESATYRQRRDGEYMQFFGRTGDGRLLAMVGEIFEDGRLRVFHANDMTKVQARAFKKG